MIKFPLQINQLNQSIDEADGRVFAIMGFVNDYDKRLIAREKMEYVMRTIEFYERNKNILADHPAVQGEPKRRGRPRRVA